MLKNKDILIIGAIIFLSGCFLYPLFPNSQVSLIAYWFVMPIGGLILIILIIKEKKEQGVKPKLIIEEYEIFKKSGLKGLLFYLIIVLIIPIVLVYWFEVRPEMIRRNCLKEAIIANDLTAFGDSYKQCLERNNYKKGPIESLLNLNFSKYINKNRF
jgi:hypothetical protein